MREQVRPNSTRLGKRAGLATRGTLRLHADEAWQWLFGGGGGASLKSYETTRAESFRARTFRPAGRQTGWRAQLTYAFERRAPSELA